MKFPLMHMPGLTCIGLLQEALSATIGGRNVRELPTLSWFHFLCRPVVQDLNVVACF